MQTEKEMNSYVFLLHKPVTIPVFLLNKTMFSQKWKWLFEGKPDQYRYIKKKRARIDIQPRF